MTLKDWAPWVGIAISLLWNLVNTVISKRQWRSGHMLQEFRTIRDPATDAIATLKQIKNRLSALELSGRDQNEFQKDWENLNKELSEAGASLQTALDTLDTSAHSTGTNWVSDFEKQWDDVVAAFQAVYGAASTQDRKRLIDAVIRKLNSSLNSVTEKIDAELKRLMS